MARAVGGIASERDIPDDAGFRIRKPETFKRFPVQQVIPLSIL